jgi:hypothetical protein
MEPWRGDQPGKGARTAAHSVAGGVANADPVEPASARAPTADGSPMRLQRGRGALSNASGRFEKETPLR